MDALPFLVVHGAVLWPVVVAGVALAVALWRYGRDKPSLLLAIGCAALAFGLLCGAGKLATSRAQHTYRTLGGHGFHGSRVPYALGNLDALALAAALPGSRGDALEELTGRFEASYVRSREALQGWQAVARLRGGCGGELAMLREQERIVELEPLVRSCDDDEEASEALLFLGWYREAADRGDSIEARIGARDWAAVVRGVAATRVALPSSRSLYVQMHPEVPRAVAPRLACAELYFRSRAGEVGAPAKLHDAVGADPFCKVIDALAQPADRQGAALVAAYAAAPDARAHDTVEALAWAAGAPLIAREYDYESPLLSHMLVELAPIDPAGIELAVLAPFAAAVRHDPEGTPAYAITHLWLAEHALLRGDLHAEANEPMLAMAGATDPSATAIGTAQALVISFALRANSFNEVPAASERDPHVAVMDAVQLARGNAKGVPNRLPLAGHDCDETAREHPAIVAAAAGDAGPLADLAERCALRDELGADVLFGVWPRLQRERGRLAVQIKLAAPDISATDRPFDVMRRAVLRRDLASLVGDRATAAAWQGVLDRHLAALADRDVAVAMVLWGLL